MARINNVEWLNNNSNRNYPIREDASRVGDSITLPQDFIVDAKITGGTPGDYYYIGEVNTNNGVITIFINDSGGNQALSFDISEATHVKYRTYTPVTRFQEEVNGKLVVDEIQEVLSTLGHVGGSSFSGFATRLEESVVVISDISQRVTSNKADGEVTKLRGDVGFRGEDGIEITQDSINNDIVISYVDPVVAVDCECPPNFPDIKTLNGQPPDCSGNFTVCGEGVITVKTQGNNICIGSIINPNQICAVVAGVGGGGGSPGPPGPPGPGGPAGPPGGVSTCDIDLDSVCEERHVEFCTADSVGIQICGAPNVPFSEEYFDIPNPILLPNSWLQHVPFVTFGELLLNSQIVKNLQECIDQLKAGTISCVCVTELPPEAMVTDAPNGMGLGSTIDFTSNGELLLTTSSTKIDGVLLTASAAQLNSAGPGDMLKSENLSGLADVATSQQNLQVKPGVDVQTQNLRLEGFSTAPALDGQIPVINSGIITFTTPVGTGDVLAANNGTEFVPATFKSNLLFGSMADQNANAVAVTGGSVTGITDITIADGGTGSSTASGARTNLGVAIGTDVQGFDAQLADIAGMSPTLDNFVTSNASNLELSTPTDARTKLGLGTGALADTTNVVCLVIDGGYYPIGEEGGTLPSSSYNAFSLAGPDACAFDHWHGLASVDSINGFPAITDPAPAVCGFGNKLPSGVSVVADLGAPDTSGILETVLTLSKDQIDEWKAATPGSRHQIYFKSVDDSEGALLAPNNLSDVADVDTARANLVARRVLDGFSLLSGTTSFTLATEINKSYRVDNSIGAFTITFPTDASGVLVDGDELYFVLTVSGGGFPTSFSAGAGTSIVGGLSTELGDFTGSAQTYRFCSATKTWYLVSGI